MFLQNKITKSKKAEGYPKQRDILQEQNKYGHRRCVLGENVHLPNELFNLCVS